LEFHFSYRKAFKSFIKAIWLDPNDISLEHECLALKALERASDANVAFTKAKELEYNR
jgi:hypothetical protein